MLLATETRFVLHNDLHHIYRISTSHPLFLHKVTKIAYFHAAIFKYHHYNLVLSDIELAVRKKSRYIKILEIHKIM